jgi:hypothetical protein
MYGHQRPSKRQKPMSILVHNLMSSFAEMIDIQLILNRKKAAMRWCFFGARNTQCAFHEIFIKIRQE